MFQNGTLVITEIRPQADDGLYSCEVTSQQGISVSKTFRISIRSKNIHDIINYYIFHNVHSTSKVN